MAAVSVAQGPGNQDKKQIPREKSIPALLDPKSLADPKGAAAAAAFLESVYQGERPPESVRMLIAVLRGSQMGPGDGWFGPSETRYTWKWLAERCGVDPAKGGIPRGAFRGQEALFARLDRNRDGVITPDDLDWSERSPYMQVSFMATRFFRKFNAQSDGRLTRDELLQFFEKAAGGKDYLSPDDFREALLAGMFAAARQGGDMPSTAVLVRGLFSGELGSMNEGPKLNERAPDFVLKTSDGKSTIQLAQVLRSKPVVLVFGSFT
jgi:hypothetical protein